MAKKSRSIYENGHAKNAPQVFLKPVGAFLSLIGKPLYFVLSRLVIFLFFVLSSLGFIYRRSVFFISRAVSGVKKQKKVQKPLHIRPPKTGHLVKIEWLRIMLFELKIWSKIKSILFISKKIPRSTRLKYKLRLITFIPFFTLVVLLFSFYFFILKDLPSPKDLTNRRPEVSTKIYDRNGNILYKIYKDKNRTPVELSQIPVHVRLATLAAEDAEFYSHPGFSIRGIFRAIIANANSGSLQGGSTITQQLIKNTLLSPEKTLTRKIKELILSIEVEANYTKDQILEMYLNEVSYGGTAYGIEEASGQYFDKDVKKLSLAEAAFLAGLPKSPTLYSPFGPNSELSISRQKEVLHLMNVNKYITIEQAKEAENEKLVFAQNKAEIKAPHFVMYVRQILVDKYGEDMVEKGGLEVTTSLDLTVEQLAEKIVESEVGKIKNLNVGNGASLVLNPQTGEILAMVGSKNYFDTAGGGNVNVLTRLRQPGSSIKVVNYAYALSNGYTPATIINDSPVTYVTPGTQPYSPVNYDGQFVGNVTLRSALAQSRNIPAVKVLASYGVLKMIEQGQKMGINSWQDPSKYGLSLTLGGGGVKGIELAQVYSTIANYGSHVELLPILEVKDYRGRILERNEVKQSAEKAVDPRIAFMLIDILKDNIARSPEFGLNSSLVIKNHPEVAVKTGTSNDLRDNWTVGFNQDFLVLTWVGNNDNSPMSRIASGITGAAPIWNKILSSLLSDRASVDWSPPNGVNKINICTLTGTLPCNSCPTKQEWFLDENRPQKSCNPEQIQKLLNPSPIPVGNGILVTGASTINP